MRRDGTLQKLCRFQQNLPILLLVQVQEMFAIQFDWIVWRVQEDWILDISGHFVHTIHNHGISGKSRFKDTRTRSHLGHFYQKTISQFYNLMCKIKNTGSHTVELGEKWFPGRGLGRIWATGCVKCWLPTLVIHSFSFCSLICSPIIKYWATFVAQ